MMKAIIFFGDAYQDAASKFNEWTEENPNFYILDAAYQHPGTSGSYYSHSICVFYEER